MVIGSISTADLVPMLKRLELEQSFQREINVTRDFESMVERSQTVCGTYVSRRLEDRLGLLSAEFLSAWRSKD